MFEYAPQNSAWRLFRGFQHDRARRARKPAMDEILQPGAFDHVMHGAAFEMQMTRMRARRIHAYAAARGPAMHHRAGHIGMKLEAERVTRLERLHRKVVALGKQLGTARQMKALAMPVIDALRPVRAE